MALRLFVLRHGETEWSRERRFAGWRDIPLSDVGRQQYEAAATALSGVMLAAVLTSPLARARSSAEMIARPHRLDVCVDPAFREMGFGEWEGRTRADVAAADPARYETWRTAPETFEAPGGESMATVAARVAGGLEELKAEHDGQCVVLVTHAIVTRLIVLGALGLGPSRLWSIDASPAGITELEYRDDWATVHRMNTLAHLVAEPAP